MAKKTKKALNIEKILNLGISVRDQSVSLNLNEKEPKIKLMIIDFINKYGDIKTILNLQELLSSSNVSRSKNIPRPQNPWVLYRKNISKGLNMSVGETSCIASYLWKKRTERESQFWNELSQITKEIHSIEYPNYKYTPVRSHDQNKRSKVDISQNTDLNTSVSKTASEIVSKEIDISPEIDINMSEIDIDMVTADFFQSEMDMDPSLFIDPSLNTDPFLIDASLIDPSLIDPSFSFIDPSLIDYSLEFN